MTIRLQHVSKCYRLKRSGAGELKRLLARAAGRAGHRPEHWALRDINLQVEQGESVALMGVNGSGKSTLLRIISGVTKPTGGQVHVKGRVGGVVDLGAGFHADLTGYENIFLHGTLLGMSRGDIRRKLDAIADFSELGSFLHSPVRHYSWGMFLRLGFSVAVHADPEVMVVDEALAVGDGYFQWKCLQRIEEMKREGRTLLFVSHVPDAAEAVCRRAVWIADGVVRADGPSQEVAEDYHRFLFGDLLEGEPMDASSEVSALAPHTRIGTGEALIRDLRLLTADGKAGRVLATGEDASLEFTAVARRPVEQVSVGVAVERPGASVALSHSDDHGQTFTLPEGETRLRVGIPRLPLRPGHYYLSVALARSLPPGAPEGAQRTLYDCHLKLYTFTVVGPEDAGTENYSTRVFRLPARVEISSVQSERSSHEDFGRAR